MAPANASAPPATHTPIIARGCGTSCATMTGTKKMPPPITFEMTIAAASSGPSRRSSATGASRANLLRRDQQPWQIELPDFHPLRRAVLRVDVHAHVAELAVLHHVRARLRRIPGVAVEGAHDERLGGVALERHALEVHVLEVLLTRRARLHRLPLQRQAAEGDVQGEGTDAGVRVLLELQRDSGDELVAAVDDAGVEVPGADIGDLQRLLQVHLR